MTWPLVTLVILDGWGIAPPGPGNAIELAGTPVFDGLTSSYPTTQLEASGGAVGLPDGQMGNSEVGHLTIGSGRILLQDLVRVTRAVESGAFFGDPGAHGARSTGHGSAVARCTCSGSSRPAGSTPTSTTSAPCSHWQTPGRWAQRTWVHAFTDGRDVSPHAAAADLATLPGERVATVVGRYYAMDRDGRWERTDRAVAAICDGIGEAADDPVAAIEASYAPRDHRRVRRARRARRPATPRPVHGRGCGVQLQAGSQAGSSPTACASAVST